MTPTEKKYTQYLGKLFWSPTRIFNHSNGDYDIVYDMVMPVSLRRRGSKGRYLLQFDVVQFGEHPSPRNIYSNRVEYDIEAGFFIQLLNKINEWSQGYIPVVTGDLKKDVDQIQKAG